jgi:gamma-glutamyl:cysteine ligase YbdK (ATP-grasp superfamily)
MTDAQPAPAAPRYGLFEVIGIELEYMLVDRSSLDIRPLADRLLCEIAGTPTCEAPLGEVTLSNELVLHVVELKVAQPAPSLLRLEQRMAKAVRRINEVLKPMGAQLMPGGAHPWMNPETEAKLWPHDGSEIYRQFDRIFGCRTHGWTNLQSMHINLPFADDEQFGRLHAAIRLILPILPALAASTPILDGRFTGLMDSRLEAYRVNARKIPSISGSVIPEPIFHMAEYRSAILDSLYRDMAPFDEAGILRYEWVNARGAIPRFERNTIEIRVLDLQECPTVDLAIASTVVAVLRLLVEERWCSWAHQKSWGVEPLRAILLDTIRSAEEAVLSDSSYLRLFGYTRSRECSARDLWDHLAVQTAAGSRTRDSILESILRYGPLARRIVRAIGPDLSRASLVRLARHLSECLAEDRLFYQ